MVKAKKDIGMVLVPGCRCRCGHTWMPHDDDEKPTACPKCKSPRWDRPYKRAPRIAKKR